jgi:hypothetical protein
MSRRDTSVDFEALRAERNRQHREWVDQMRDQGWQVSLCSINDEKACYCACATGGPCEHAWDGEPYDSPITGAWSTTCSKCGELSYSHSLRTGP